MNDFQLMHSKRLLIRTYPTIDIEKAVSEANAATQRILAAL